MLPQSAHMILLWLTAISRMTHGIPTFDLGFIMINPVIHSKAIKKLFSALEITTNTIIIIITIIMECMCYIDSFKGCEVIWWVGGALVCTGNGAGHTVWQQEGRTCVSALLHTRGEAVCCCQSCQRLGSLSLAKQDLWLNYILCSFIIWRVQITILSTALYWVRFHWLVNLHFFCTILFSLLLLILSNKT